MRDQLWTTEKQVKTRKIIGFKLAGFLLGQLAQDIELEVRVQRGNKALRLGTRGAPRYVMVLDEPALLWELIRDPDPGLGETYMEGRWDLEEGDLGAFLSALAAGRQRLLRSPAGLIFKSLLSRPDDYDHDPENSRKQIRHHYDLCNDLYELFLDEGMNYSCAFFNSPQDSLREAQLNKIRTAIARLDVRPGMRVLDIGCGWGETARLLAKEAGAASASGITLARNQYDYAQRKAATINPAPIYFLEDYREHAASHREYYDRIVSIGMFEHVGEENREVYFRAVRDQLKKDGRALIHSIVRSPSPDTDDLSSPWLDKYIFPGGSIPTVNQMVNAGRAAGLRSEATYIHESFNYAETLRRWRANFLANMDGLNPSKYDARFKRMWIFYLSMCEAMFDGCGYRVAHAVFTKV